MTMNELAMNAVIMESMLHNHIVWQGIGVILNFWQQLHMSNFGGNIDLTTVFNNVPHLSFPANKKTEKLVAMLVTCGCLLFRVSDFC